MLRRIEEYDKAGSMELVKSRILSCLSANIRTLRRKHGMSQEELARMIGLNRGNIASYENGTAEPKICNLLKLSRVFGVSILDLTAKNLEEHPDHPVNQQQVFLPAVLDQEQLEQFGDKARMLASYLEGLHKCYTYKKAKVSTEAIPPKMHFAFDFFEQLYDAAQSLLDQHQQLLGHAGHKDEE